MSVTESGNLEIQNISKSFRSHGVFSNLNFSFTAGELFWISGKNGVGKSTLLRILSGLLRPDTGKVFYNGAELSSSVQRAQVLPLIGAVLQQDFLYKDLTIRENIQVFSRLFQNGRDAFPFYSTLNLEPFLDTRIAHCSQGVRRKAALVRALIGAPKFLFLDEIFSHLDLESTTVVESFLDKQVEEGVTIVVTGHTEQSSLRHRSQHLELSEQALVARGIA